MWVESASNQDSGLIADRACFLSGPHRNISAEASMSFLAHVFHLIRNSDDRVLSALAHMEVTMSAYDDKIAALRASIEADRVADTSIIALVTGLSGQLADVSAQLKAANPTIDLSALDDLKAAIDDNTVILTAAVTANTPAAPVVTTDAPTT